MSSNISILVLPFVPPWKDRSLIRLYVYPAIAGGWLFITAIYYALCFGFPGHSIIQQAGVEVKIKSMCRRHPRFGYKYRVFITPIDGPSIGYIARILRWCFGWTLDSPMDRVNPEHASQVWLEEHDSTIRDCTCGGIPMVDVSPPLPAPIPQDDEPQGLDAPAAVPQANPQWNLGS